MNRRQIMLFAATAIFLWGGLISDKQCFSAEPEMEISPTGLTPSVQQGQTAQETLKISNQGDAVLNWATLVEVGSSSKNLKRGDVVREITLPAELDGPVRPAGMVFDGTHIWIAVRWQFEIPTLLYKLDPQTGQIAGTLNITHLNQQAVDPQGIAFDGQYLYINNFHFNQIFVIKPATGELVRTLQPFAQGEFFMGMTIGGGALWVSHYSADSSKTRSIKKLNPIDGTILGTIPQPWPLGNMGYHGKLNGLTYFNGALWMSPEGGDSQKYSYTKKVFKVDPLTGKKVLEYNSPTLSPSGTTNDGVSEIWFLDPFQRKIFLSKSGEVTWLTVNPELGNVSLGNTENISVTADGSITGIGVHQAVIHFSTNDSDEGHVVVPVTFTVGNGTPNNDPVISIGPNAVPNPVNENEVVQFSVTATDIDGDGLSFSWDFGDGNSGLGNAPNHSYSSAGSYTATVTITDGNGGSTSGSILVVVDGGSVTGPGDLNDDGVVNITDLTIVTSNFGKTSSDSGFDSRADSNSDGVINIVDLTVVTSNFGKTY